MFGFEGVVLSFQEPQLCYFLTLLFKSYIPGTVLKKDSRDKRNREIISYVMAWELKSKFYNPF